MKKLKTITYKGETLIISEWGKRYNLSACTISMRISRGWSLDKTFSGVPVHRVYEINGESLTINELGNRYNISPSTIYWRMSKGWSVLESISSVVSNAGIDRGIDEFNFIMRRFYTKEQRLESYKRLIADMKEQRMKIAA